MTKKELLKFRASYVPYTRPCVYEGVELALHYDEKEIAKSIGARWQPAPNAKGGCWWMPQDKLKKHAKCSHIPEMSCDSSAIITILNKLKWIVGNYGEISRTLCDVQTNHHRHQYSEPNSFVLKKEDDTAIFQHWIEFDAVKRTSGVGQTGRWLSPDEGREMWNSLVADGYNAATQHETISGK